MEDRYLSVPDVKKIAEKPFNVIKFSELRKYKSLDDLFEVSSMGMRYQPVNDILILYEMKLNSGHWCVLKRIPDKRRPGYFSYHFLDSYGEIIDDQRKHINKDFRIKSGQDTQLILEKLSKQIDDQSDLHSGVSDIFYNDKELQGDSSSTCGRYAGLFIRFDEPVDSFAKKLKALAKKKRMTVDDLVIHMTAKLLNGN